MKHLSRRWLIVVHCLYLLVDLILLGAAISVRSSHNYLVIAHWGFTNVVITLVVIHLVYGTTIYWWLQRKNIWLATVISQILFDGYLAAIVEASNYNNLVYRVGWIVTVGISTVLGPLVAAGEVVANAGLNFLVLIGIAESSTYSSLVELLFTIGVAVAALVGWLLFNRHYEQEASSTVKGLSDRLLQEQSRSNIIIESIDDGVIAFDRNGKISLMNASAAQFTEWKPNEAIGLDIHLIMKLVKENGKPLDDGDLFGQVIDKSQPSSHIFELEGQHKRRTIISLAISPISDPANSKVIGAVAVFRDVTQERHEEQQRVDFISTASHEMRTPVAAIEGYLALAMNNKVSTIDSKAREYLDKAHESTQHLGKLFQDLLTSAKAEDGRLSSHPVVVEMGAFLEQLSDSLRFAAQKKNLGMEYLVGTSDMIDATTSTNTTGGARVIRPLYYVYADPDRIREVITNIFDNAVKYTAQGKIGLGLTGDNEVVQFYIRDSGSGIPAEDIPHLFQKFYRVDNSSTRTVGGTGLGLFISRKIIELYHGRIWVESEIKQGSTFYINLPRLNTQKAQELQTKESTQASLPAINSLASP